MLKAGVALSLCSLMVSGAIGTAILHRFGFALETSVGDATVSSVMGYFSAAWVAVILVIGAIGLLLSPRLRARWVVWTRRDLERAEE